MISAYFTIGSKCNHKCLFCPCIWEERNQEIVLSVFQKMINEIEVNKKIDSVILSGGEPTIQNNFFEILTYLSNTRLYIRLLTNADRLSNNTMVEKIKSIISTQKMDIITAIHSYNSTIHDSITGCNGSFDRTNTGLHNMINAGFTVHIKFCISKINYKDMTQFIDFIYNNFPDSVSLSLCSIDYCGNADKNNEKVKISFKEVGKYLAQALEKVENYKTIGRKRNVIVSNTPLCCIEPKYWKYFISESKKSTEAFLPLPTNNEGKLKYNNASGSGTFFKACQSCAVEKYCAGTWFSTYKLFGENAVKRIQINEKI